MRPIKFRAWSKKDKCLCGAFSIHKSGLFSEMINTSLVNGQCVADAHWENLDEEQTIVLMQFTGLLDKNGKEIFENDVVLANGRRQVVEFKFGKWLIVDLLKDDPYTNMLYDFIHDDGAHRIEIIGNRFEHPELLNPPQGK